jgi:hypothetical protein
MLPRLRTLLPIARVFVRTVVLMGALAGVLLGSSGPGMLVASLATLAGDHAHNISLERDAGHADVVLCHDPAEIVRSDAVQIRAHDCEDDHRLHVTTSGDLVRTEGKTTAASRSGALVVVAPCVPPLALARHEARAGFDPALDAASRLHRTIVLRL